MVSDGDQATVGPVNLLLHSLFRQVDVTFNDTLVSSSRDTYPYRALITTLLSYGDATKKSWLKRLEGWEMDEPTKYDLAANSGLKNRTKPVANSKTFDRKGRLHVDMMT